MTGEGGGNMLQRFRMPLFIHPDTVRSSRFGRSCSRHFHDYLFSYYGFL
jgi:hypothetical protein